MAIPTMSTMSQASSSTLVSQVPHKYKRTKTVAVMGAAYGGARAAKLLSQGLPDDWKLVVIDRNTHFNHVYVFPRFTVVPQHAPKAYVPTVHHLKKSKPDSSTPLPTPPLTPPSSSSSDGSPFEEDDMHKWVHGSITSLSPHSVTFTRPCTRSKSPVRDGSASASAAVAMPTEGYEAKHGVFEGPAETIEFDYAVYALGAGLPDPVNVWKPAFGAETPEDQTLGAGTKRSGVRFMERKAETLKRAQRILIVGGGALGIQYATDLKSVYPEKEVTLLHSRPRLMPIYPIEMHTTIMENLKRLGVEIVLGERVVTWPSHPECLDGEEKIVTTDKGRTFTSDIVLPCTGQKPHVTAMAALCPETISPTSGRIRVRPTMQVSNGPLRPAATRANTLEKLEALSLHSPQTASAAASRGSDTASTAVGSEAGGGDLVKGAKGVTDLSHLFAVGDCAETGAIQAGHTAYYQAEVAARNILRLVKADEGGEVEELEDYKVSVPAIKVTLGMTRGVISNAEGTKVSDEGVEDLHAMVMWPGFQADHMEVHE